MKQRNSDTVESAYIWQSAAVFLGSAEMPSLPITWPKKGHNNNSIETSVNVRF
jgi:hypothetical protein